MRVYCLDFKLQQVSLDKPRRRFSNALYIIYAVSYEKYQNKLKYIAIKPSLDVLLQRVEIV